MRALFVDVNPQIEISGFSPFHSGCCDWGGGANELTSLGKRLGKNYSRACVSFAGPLTDLAMTGVSLWASHFVKESSSLVSLSILLIAWYYLINYSAYAVSDLLFKEIPDGDFSSFATHSGLSPQITLFAVAASVLATAGLLLF